MLSLTTWVVAVLAVLDILNVLKDECEILMIAMVKVPVFKIKAKIKLFPHRRKRFIEKSGYRPAFKIFGEGYNSGQITLIGRDRLNPGEECDAEIWFVILDTVKQHLYVGRKIEFSEGIKPIGEAVITEILGTIYV